MMHIQFQMILLLPPILLPLHPPPVLLSLSQKIISHLLQLLSTSVMELPNHLLSYLTVLLASLRDTLPYYPKDATPRPSINSLEILSLEPSAVTNK